jgi:hypothetical protein
MPDWKDQSEFDLEAQKGSATPLLQKEKLGSSPGGHGGSGGSGDSKKPLDPFEAGLLKDVSIKKANG